MAVEEGFGEVVEEGFLHNRRSISRCCEARTTRSCGTGVELREKGWRLRGG